MTTAEARVECEVCGEAFETTSSYRGHFNANDHKPPWQSESALREMYWGQKLTIDQLAEELGCAKSTIIKWMDRHGVERRDSTEAAASGEDHPFWGGRETTPEKLQDEDWVREKYVVEGLSQYEIAGELGCSRTAVKNAMDRHGINPDPYRYENTGPDAKYNRLTQENWLEYEYVEKKRSTLEISSEVGCSVETVCRWLRKHDIGTRSFKEAVGTGEDHHLWRGGRARYYGPSWYEQRKKSRERDNLHCRRCGLSENEHKEKWSEELHVHHITPFRNFSDHEKANQLSNLLTLCRECHQKMEGLPIDTREVIDDA